MNKEELFQRITNVVNNGINYSEEILNENLKVIINRYNLSIDDIDYLIKQDYNIV